MAGVRRARHAAGVGFVKDFDSSWRGPAPALLVQLDDQRDRTGPVPPSNAPT